MSIHFTQLTTWIRIYLARVSLGIILAIRLGMPVITFTDWMGPIWLLFYILFPGVGLSAEQAVSGQTSNSQGFSLRENTWTGELLQIARDADPNRVNWPPSLRNSFTRRERNRVAEAAVRLREPVLNSCRTILTAISENTHGYDLGTLTGLFRDEVKKRFVINPYTERTINKGVSELEHYWKHFLSGVPLHKYRIETFARFAREYEKTMNHYREKYPALVDQEVTVGASFGYMASQMIMDSLGREPASAKSIAAISLLHPITDNALDHNLNIGPSMNRITKLLSGENPKPENTYEEVVFELINDIFDEFPPATHPLLAHSLKELHLAQLRSNQIQRNPNATSEDLIKIASEKGGYTGIVLAYLSLGGLTDAEAEFFYKSGTIFQLGDDLLDLKEDQKDGVRTLWTTTMGSKPALLSALSKFASIHNRISDDAKNIFQSHPNRDALLLNHDLGFKFYLVNAFITSHAGGEFEQLLSEKFPLGSQNLKSVVFSTYQKVLQESKGLSSDLAQVFEIYQRIFDKHFFQGEFAQNGRESQLTPEQTWTIKGQGLAFPIARLIHETESFLKKSKLHSLNLPHEIPTTLALLHGVSLFLNHSPIYNPLWLAAGVPFLVYRPTRIQFVTAMTGFSSLYLNQQLAGFEMKALVPFIYLWGFIPSDKSVSVTSKHSVAEVKATTMALTTLAVAIASIVEALNSQDDLDWLSGDKKASSNLTPKLVPSATSNPN